LEPNGTKKWREKMARKVRKKILQGFSKYANIWDSCDARPIFNIAPRGELCPRQVKVAPSGWSWPPGVNFVPQRWRWLLGLKLAPRLEDPLFPSQFFYLRNRVCSPLGTEFTPRTVVKTGLRQAAILTSFTLGTYPGTHPFFPPLPLPTTLKESDSNCPT
jgi:hypothetical protein